MTKILAPCLLTLFAALAFLPSATAQDPREDALPGLPALGKAARASLDRGLPIPAGKIVNGVFVPYTAEEIEALLAQSSREKNTSSPPPASGFHITLNPGAALQANPPALAAFRRAAALWEAVIKDNVTVVFDADVKDLGNKRTLGQIATATMWCDYDVVRDHMVADASAEEDDSIVNSLPSAGQFAFIGGAGQSFNGIMFASSANLKAIGVRNGSSVDGSITFNANFDFDYDNSDGVDDGHTDFETVACHEIGHALGFISGVDKLEASITPSPQDLFRFEDGTANDPATAQQFHAFPRRMVGGGDHIFDEVSADPLYPEFKLSTGEGPGGDGGQLGHWKDDKLTNVRIGIMDPTLPPKQVWKPSAADLRMLDLVGYDISSPNAEIAVQQPAGANLVKGGTVGFGAVVTNTPHTLTFTVKNIGSQPLSVSGVSLLGGNADSFTVSTAGMSSSLAALTGQTTFTVTFKPTAELAYETTLRIASNDADEGTYDIILTGNGAPPVTFATPTVANVQYSSATFHVEATGGVAITERGFLYGRSILTSDPYDDGGIHVTKIVVPGTTGSFSREIGGLLSSTGYTFRAYAIHAGGIAYSPVETFTTPAGTGPTAVTQDATNITTTSVTLNGTVSGNGYGGSIYFQYGLPWQNLLYAGSIAVSQPLFSGPTPVSVTITGLLPHTQYCFRVVGEGGPGGWVTAYGGEATFTTANTAPVATNKNVTGQEDLNTPMEMPATDADGDSLTFNIITPPSHGILTPDSLGRMRYWPDPDYSSASGLGDDSFTFTASDGYGGTSNPATVTIRVTPVNDPPTMDDIDTPAPILEDAGDQTILVAGITAGPLEPSQTLTVTAFSNDPSLIPTPTVKYTTGQYAEITYRPVANANGTAVLTVTVSDGGLATSRSFNAAVTAVNDRPSFVIPTAPMPAGALWTPRDTNRSWNSIRSSPDGVKLVASVSSGYIYTSSDSGETWTPRSGSGSRQWTAVATSSDGSRLAATEQYGSIYISTDSGATWQRQMLDWNADKNESWNSIASSADGLKMIASSGHTYTYSAGLGFYKGGGFYPESWRGVACSADGLQRAAVVYGGQIYTWSTYNSSPGLPRDSNRNWTAVACSSDGRKMAATVEGGQIYTSTDFGENWTPRGPVRSWRKITSSADGTKLAAIGGTLIYTSTDSGLTWAEHGVSQNWTDITSSADGEKLAAVVAGGQIYTSTALPYSVPAAANAGPVSMPAFATSISPGPPDEAAQTLSFTVTNDRNALFTTQPALNAAGTLTFTPNPAMTGTALVTVTVQDNGGTANGGVNTSFPQTFNIAVGQSTAVVATPTSTSITRTAATLGANITSDGGAPIMERGVVYSRSADNLNPVKGGAGVVTVMIAGTTGVLTTNLSGLAPASSYTFKAYAITSAGIIYSPAATFTTLGQGDLDLAFGTGGKTTMAVDLDAIVGDVAVQSDGKVVITGSSSKIGVGAAVELVRLTSGGAPDTSFGISGRVTTSIGSSTSRGQAVVIQGDGKILVLAEARAEGQVLPVVALARYTNSGVLDSSFGNGGIVLTPTVSTSSETAYASDLVLQSDGRIVVAGMIQVGSVRSYMLLRYTTSGVLDTSFGTGGKSIVPAGFINPASVAMQADGKIVVAGRGWDVKGVFELARFTSNGSLDTGFGTNGVVQTSFVGNEAAVSSVALQSDGKIVAVGYVYLSNGQAVALARYTAQGVLDADFGDGGKLTTRISTEDEGRSVALQSDGKIVVGGWTTEAGSAHLSYYMNNFAVWRYTSTGALDTGFGSGGVAITSFGGGRDRAWGLALGGDGTIVVAGTDDTNPGIYPTKYEFAVARHLGGAVPPPVTWPLSSSITVTGATLGGTVTGDGGAGVSERGVIYAPTATNSNPEIGGSGVVKVPVTGTTGAFTSAVTGLAPGTTYSYKAYATNPLGTGYTGAGVFTTAGSLPVVTSPTFSSVTVTSAFLGGNVTQAGDAPIIERGIVYSLSSVNDVPAIGGAEVTKVSVPGTTGVFTVNVTGLAATQGHIFRAYAISALGVSYSSVAAFTTAGNNANLAGMSLSAGTLSPAFAPGTSSYTASVPNAITAITLTPAASAPNDAAIFVNDVRVMSGSASMSIPLELGENLVSTVVIASDAVTKKTYTVRVARTALPVIVLPGSGQVGSTSATLGATITSTGFAAIEEQGIVMAPTATNDTPRIGGAGVIKLTNVAVFPDRYEVSAAGLAPGVRYSFAGFATNSEGTSYSSTATFTTVNDDASLGALVLSTGTLSPAFASATPAYACTVPSTAASLTVTPTTANAGATVRVNGGVVLSGSASPALPLQVGLNPITILVTAQDGATTRIYTVAVTRQSVTEHALENWAAAQGLPPSAAGPMADADGDGVPNLMEFAFGTSPSTSSSAPVQFSGTFAGGVTLTQPGQPVAAHESKPDGTDYRAVFVRRTDHEAVGLTYTVKFSADLVTWQTSTVTPTILGSDGTHEAVSVPYPLFIGGKKARFFTVGVDAAP